TKDVSNLNRDECLKFGQECYKKFLSGCLDLCDNIVDGKVVTPQNIVKWEDEDPYFVVAADKGTATFSDIANSVSAQYGFWLGDAFASGGSNGYDHKKMGITAKGGWIAVRRHMMEIGVDIQKQDFSVVGIGDMSGDVFGNGMLLSQHTCLIAAFNHLHIFVDPTPNAEKSFPERQRLFNLPRSTWADYNKELISKGGMIYERSAKTCKLTPEIKSRFGITQDELSPNELIVYILKAQYDLLWNGGIGTYVKSSSEKHVDVGDKANNAIRVDGKELRCLVIGEGGNLGMTQKGRIEYAQNGGRLNTDAMDNSAGVNCSDVEVNIKIILNKLVDSGALSLEQRNVLLEEMTPEVERLVLRNNYLQTQAITLVSYNQGLKIDSQELMMKKLEVHTSLDRENEFLPLTEEMHKRKASKNYLTRPELCVLFAYSKIYLYQELLKSTLIEEKYFENDLLTYFPKQMQEKFKEDILSHKLSREIIATSVNNSVINRVGITFMNDIIEELQCKPCDIVRAYIIIREVFGLKKLWASVEELDFKINTEMQTQIFYDINQFIYKCIRLLLNRNVEALPITNMVENMTGRINTLIDCIKQFSKESGVSKKVQNFVENGVSESIAIDIITTIEAMQMFQLTFENSDDLMRYVTVYYHAMNDIPVGKISGWVKNIVIENSLYKLALHELEEKFDTKYANLVSRITNCGAGSDDCISQWKEVKEKQISRFEKLVCEVDVLEKQDVALISMVVDKLDIL
ncbi:MAG: NAD-glutamate dehydrogenase, partial [Proteobacteria bacterium]|nr:NAD-glutamate dehydrogenase [Pseudomonadota bacterium]